MNQKICKLLLAVALMVTTLVGCGEKGESNDAIGTLITALEKTNKATSTSGNISMDISAEMEGYGSENIEMNMDFIINNINDVDALEMMADIMVNSADISQSITMYMKDGNSYTDMLGTKTKTTGSNEYTDISNQINIESIEADEIITADMKESGNNKIITVELKEEAIKELVLDNLEQQYSGLFTEDDFVIDSYKIEYTVGDDGYIYEQVIEFKITVSMYGLEMIMDVKADAKYDSFEPTEINFPDFSDYTEYDYE